MHTFFAITLYHTILYNTILTKNLQAVSTSQPYLNRFILISYNVKFPLTLDAAFLNFIPFTAVKQSGQTLTQFLCHRNCSFGNIARQFPTGKTNKEKHSAILQYSATHTDQFLCCTFIKLKCAFVNYYHGTG